MIINGTNLSNVLFGTISSDIIDGKGGDDWLHGNNGNDHLWGGEDNDHLYGEGDSDVLFGEDGDDELFGGSGNDLLYGGENDDVLNGGDGTNWLYGDGGSDTVTYEDASGGVGVWLGYTTVPQGNGLGRFDYLYTIENVTGSYYEDFIYGDDGDNVLKGLGGNDFFFAGAGADTIDGGSGIDTANYIDWNANVLTPMTINLATGVGSGGEAEGDRLISVENVTAAFGADVIIGNAEANILEGLEGNDTLEGGAGADTLDGGEGIDIASYEHSDAAVMISLHDEIGPGNQGGDADGDMLISIESIKGSQFGDWLVGDENANDLFGNDEGDTLVGLGGSDLLDGGEGDDVLYGDFDHWSLRESFFFHVPTIPDFDILIGGPGDDFLDGGGLGDWIDGGENIDTVSYQLSDAGVTIDLKNGIATGGHATGDVLLNIENIEGSAYEDELLGDAGSNVLAGFDGDDELVGRAGDDTLAGGTGADHLDGGRGSDLATYKDSENGVILDLEAGSGSAGEATGDTFTSIENVTGSNYADEITGDGGDNVLTGLDGNDVLHGGAGFDGLVGGEDDDILFGGEGGDWLFGGDGDDILEGGAGGDLILGGDNNDTLSYTDSDAAVTINLAAGTASGGHAEGDLFDEIENVTGSDYADTLTGDSGANVLKGGGGADTLSGGGGADRLVGGAGDDLLIGGTGTDVLIGGADDDTFYFGPGAFGFLPSNDTIVDFHAGAGSDDVIVLEALSLRTFGDVLANSTQNGADTVIQVDQLNSITLVSVALTDLHYNDFIFA
jgi:Ca2+-binding RTX toxin-like protein